MDGEEDSDLQIKSKIYGKDKYDVTLTQYQKAINEAAYNIAKANPVILVNRKELMTQAQKIVRESYSFKKGFSRSKFADNHTKENTEVKKNKTFKEERALKLNELKEKMSEVKKMISFKTLRRDKCASVKEWKTCETLSGDISKLLSEKSQLEREVLLLERKEKKSKWYQKRRSSESSTKISKKVKSSAVTTSTSTITTSTPGKGSAVDITNAFSIRKNGNTCNAGSEYITAATTTASESEEIKETQITAKTSIECNEAGKTLTKPCSVAEKSIITTTLSLDVESERPEEAAQKLPPRESEEFPEASAVVYQEVPQSSDMDF